MLTVGTLLAVLGLLSGRTAAVRTGDILLLLGFGLHLTLVGVTAVTATTKRDAVLQYFLKILFACHFCSSKFLVVEQSDASERHRDAVLVASHDDMVVTYRAASLGNELHATLVGTLDVVAEGEEGI